MTKSTHRLFGRGLALLMAVLMCLNLVCVSAFADTADETRAAIYLGVPADVADGVYYADINMRNASNPKQYSMGNAALRGSDSYKAKRTDDTAYRPIVVVQGGKATALVEFMPMGYLGMYGFMMELEGIYPGSFTRYGMPNASDPKTVFTPTQTLTYQKTQAGEIVYDGYNNPDSEYKFDGQKLRPAGFGREASYLNIVDQPYSHLLSVDVTPVMAANADETAPTKAADYTYDHAAFCHVFVPVMFDISASSGDQYARMQVDWTSLTKIDNPEMNVQYMLWKAGQVDTEGYSEASVAAFNAAYSEVHAKLENVWAKRVLDLDGTGFNAQPVLDLVQYTDAEQQAMALQLKTAIDGLSKLSTDALSQALSDAKAIDSTLYTAESYQKLADAITAAQAVLDNSASTQEEIDAQAAALRSAIDALETVSKSDGWDGKTVSEPKQLDDTSVNITSAEELAWLAQQVNSGRSFTSVFLDQDIDLNGKAWTAIGTQAHPFSGTFYGNGHTVSNLLVTAGGSYQGLFGYLKGTASEKAGVKDLNVQGVVKTTANYVGGVVGGALYTNIENVHSSVSVTVDRVNNKDYAATAGGVVGEMIYGSVYHCSNTGAITAPQQEKVGGVAGYASGTYIRESYNTADITAGASTGGVVGHFIAYGTVVGVMSCYNTGDVSGVGSGVGGVAGSAVASKKGDTAGMAVLSSLYNRGDVTAQHTVGGIVGSYTGGDVSQLSAVYSTGKVTSTNDNAISPSTGALVGRMYSGQIYGAYALEGTADALYTLGQKSSSSTMQLVSKTYFKAESWFKGDDFFTEQTNLAENFAKDPGTLNDGYPVLNFQLEDILNAAKADAVAELVAYKDLNKDYSGLSKDAATKVKSDAVTAIAAAESVEQVNSLLEQAKKDLDAIPNDPNYGLQLGALKAKLAEAKELEAKGDALYTTDSWNSFSATITGVEYLLETGFGTQEKVDTYLGYLTSNMDGLTYRAADYSAVDEALSKVPADLSGYTDESVAALRSVIDAVDRTKNITEQAAVDKMARDILSAVAGLEKTGALDWNNLADGVYAIDFEMLKLNRTDLSMSNDAVNHTAKLVVKDGNYTLTVQFKGLHYLNRFGYLAKLSYYNDGYSYGDYGAVIGTRSEATVLTTQKNADGTDVSDEFNVPGGTAEGQLYPKSVSFPLVATARADAESFVPLHVFVPVMEDISAGTGDQDVLMHLDRSSLRETTEDDPAFEPEKPQELSPAVDYTDEATGVMIHADKGVLPKGVQIVVTEITEGADYDAAAQTLASVGRNFKLYSVKFLDSEGNEVAPSGAVELSLPAVGSGELALYRVNGDGKTLVKGTAADGYYTAATKTAGNYAIVAVGSTSADEPANPSTPGASTGDSGVMLWGLLLTAAAGMIAVMAVSRRKETRGE